MKTIGYRLFSAFDFAEPAVGDPVAPSRVHVETDMGWEPTNDIEPGACAFDTLRACQKYARHTPGWIAVIEGDLVSPENLDDRLKGEIMLANAVVVGHHVCPGEKFESYTCSCCRKKFTPDANSTDGLCKPCRAAVLSQSYNV